MLSPAPDPTVSEAPELTEDRDSSDAWLYATGVFIVALGWFVMTMCRTVYWWDSGELAANVQVLGIAHRPGFPLYVLVGRLFGIVPFGDLFYRINFVSALSAAFALAGIGHFVFRSLRSSLGADSLWERILPTMLAVVGIGGTYSYWIQAVRAEVYAPNLVIVVLLLGCMWRADHELEHGNAPEGKRWLSAAALLGGLGFAVHNATFASTLPAFALLGVYLARRHRLGGSLWLAVIALFALGLSVQMYLPVRAGQDPPLNWGWVSDAGSPGWTGVAGADAYREILSTKAGILAGKMRLVGTLLFDQLEWALVVFGVIGLVTLWRVTRRWTLVALGIILGNMVVTALLVTEFSDTNADVHGYLLPAFAACALPIAAGMLAFWRSLMTLIRRFLPTPAAQTILKVACAAMVILVALAPVIIYKPFCDLSDHRLAYEFGTESIATLRPNAVVILAGTNWDFVLRGLRYVDGWRPDLIVINRDLLPAAWYRQWLYRDHPELAAIEIPSDSTKLLVREWGVELIRSGYPVYWEFTERDVSWSKQMAPAGHLFELLAQPVDALAPNLISEQEDFERASRFYNSPDRIQYDFDAKLVWVMNLYRAGMYYESRGLLGRAKEMYQRALSLAPNEERVLAAFLRVDPGMRVSSNPQWLKRLQDEAWGITEDGDDAP